ncbi:MAG TPA: hypothetical protein VM344_01510, partial [Vitreimonas sp.]|nr:hypothetical protein [Vitreimonas sp.]
ITADGREAEIAIPPVPVGRDFSSGALALAHVGRRRLGAAVPFGDLEGYSTHLSVSVPDALGDAVASRYAATYAPALMLLLESPSSPGVLIRPRPGRLELGGEFVDGDRLRAVVLFAVGSVLATIRASRRRWIVAREPRSVRVRLEPAIERFGWYVDRRAFGPDLSAEGRSARLTTVRGNTVTAQQHLERCWAIARRELRGRASDEELALVDEYVDGQRPLGVEVRAAVATALVADGPVSARPVSARADSSFGEAAKVRERPGYTVEPVVIGWDVVVLRVRTAAAAAYAALPRRCLARGFEALDRGDLDATLIGALAAAADRSAGPALAHASQAGRPGLYSRMGAVSSLVARERDPEVGDRKDRRREDEQRVETEPAQPGLEAVLRAPVSGQAPSALGQPVAALEHPAGRAARLSRQGLAVVAAVVAVALLGGAFALAQLAPGRNDGPTLPAAASRVAATDPFPSEPLPSDPPASLVVPPVVATYTGIWSRTSCASDAEGLCDPVPDRPAVATILCSEAPPDGRCFLTLTVEDPADEMNGLVLAVQVEPAEAGTLRNTEAQQVDPGMGPACIYEDRTETTVTYDEARMQITQARTIVPRTCSDETSTLYHEDRTFEFEGDLVTGDPPPA